MNGSMSEERKGWYEWVRGLLLLQILSAHFHYLQPLEKKQVAWSVGEWETWVEISVWMWFEGPLAHEWCSVVSDSVWPHRRQPIRFPHPWDSPGKNTGVGCHFLSQFRLMYGKKPSQYCNYPPIKINILILKIKRWSTVEEALMTFCIHTWVGDL